MGDYEITAVPADIKYSVEFDNYSPSATSLDTWEEGFDDIVSYGSFEEGFQAIFAGLKKIFGATDSTKDEAKTPSVSLETTPTPNTTASASNITIVAKTEACKAEFAEFGLEIPIQEGAPEADANMGSSLQESIYSCWVDPDKLESEQQRMVDIGIGDAAAERRGMNETPIDATAAEFVIGLAALAAGRNLNASTAQNLIVNAAGKIISRSQNVTQSTKHPKPERSYVSQQNAQQQKQAAAAVAMIASLTGGAGSKRITTSIAGAFSQFTAAGMAGSFQPDQGIVYEFPVEGPDGEYKYVLDEGLQKRYGTSPAT